MAEAAAAASTRNMSGVTTAAEPMPTAPMSVAIIRFSCRMRAITGKAVTASAAPRMSE